MTPSSRFRRVEVRRTAAVFVTALACATVQSSPSAAPLWRGTIRIQDNSTAIAYSGSWIQGNTSKAWNGGTAAIGFSLCHRLTFVFHGTGVSWIGERGPGIGIARVYLDAAPPCGDPTPPTATVDGYAASDTLETPLYTASGLAWGTHTLIIDVTRTKNPAASDYLVVVDALDVAGARPDIVKPTVDFTRPAASSTVAGILPVTASATDNVGVVGVTFFVDKVQLGPEDVIPPYSVSWNTTVIADGTHTLSAVARDDAGNVSVTKRTVIVSNANPPPTARATRYENTDLSITYTDGCPICGQSSSWYQGSRSRDWSGGTSAFNRSDGARATFHFNGTAVSWIGFRAGWAGIANVYVDGTFAGEIDLYESAEEVQAPVFTASGLAPGAHTLTVESTGRKNPISTDYAVVVDAFDVSPSTPPPVDGTRFEETAAQIAYTAVWTKNDASKPWSGGTAAFSATTGQRATFAFAGTTVSWFGLRGPQTGVANIYLDGSFQATIDTYSQTEVQSLIYSTTSLAPGTHTLAVEVASASGGTHPIYVDAFDVRTRFEDTDFAVQYTGTWVLEHTNRNWSGTSVNTAAGTAAESDVASASALFTFKGTSVSWIGYRGPSAGIANVYVDGSFVSQFDLYSATEQLRVPIYTASGLSTATTHTLRVEATGTQNASATGATIAVDAFDVALPLPAPAVTRIQEDAPAVAYTGSWNPPGTTILYSGETARNSTTVGAKATITFSGTSIRWIGDRGMPSGVARVSIDGNLITTVDTKAMIQHAYQAPVFSATGLSAGTHTLTIEVVGRNDEPNGTTVEAVLVDAFEIF
jgi:Big-like domain-containing protein